MGKLIKLIRALSIKQVVIGVAVIGIVSGGTYATYNVVQANKAKNVVAVETAKTGQTGQTAVPESNKTETISTDTPVKNEDNSNKTTTANASSTDNTTQQTATSTNNSTTQSSNNTQSKTNNNTTKQNTTNSTNTNNSTSSQPKPQPTPTPTPTPTPIRASGIDQALTDKFNEKLQTIFAYENAYPEELARGSVDKLKQAAISIALNNVVPDTIKNVWYPITGNTYYQFKFRTYSLNIVTNEDDVYYTRFKPIAGMNTGFSYVIAYWDSSIAHYKIYYVRISLA